jgi:hypothetical protein
MQGLDLLGQRRAAVLRRSRLGRIPCRPVVSPRPGDPEQPSHPRDVVSSLLRVHHVVRLYRRVLSERKRAVAFLGTPGPREARCLNLQPLQLGVLVHIQTRPAGVIKARPFDRHHRPSSCSPTPISPAIVAIGRPASITNCAASRRYSDV